jgi:hypothetical protein
MKLSHQIRRLRRHRAISLHLAAGKPEHLVLQAFDSTVVYAIR